jgi:hypothetical protein
MSDLDHLLDRLRAAPTRKHAEDIFAASDWIFLGMSDDKREHAYAAVDEILACLPGDD